MQKFPKTTLSISETTVNYLSNKMLNAGLTSTTNKTCVLKCLPMGQISAGHRVEKFATRCCSTSQKQLRDIGIEYIKHLVSRYFSYFSRVHGLVKPKQ